MEQRFTLLTLGVADLGRSIAFYEALGWKRSMKGVNGVAFFQCNGVAFGLYPRGDLVSDTGLEDGGAGFRGVSIAFNTRTRNEVATVLDEAVSAGGTLIKAGQDTPWGGHVGYFADPDGHLWEVAWNPAFPLDEAGNVTLPD
ncbi:MAG: VOC family protein [Minwuia sp.]|uniref:VOC family protein n=1 Tax=Minwuia sp. TaxID=2493630 RepID=UPI003A8B59EC